MTTHSIGEVLNRLKAEFDDITISKIRFLEAEGLITPDRTESGYRKFTEPDIERLRYVLRAQRDRYLPLKVIKDELARIDLGEVPQVFPTAPSLLDGQDGGDDHPGTGRSAAPDGAAVPPTASASDEAPSLRTPQGEAHLSARELSDTAGVASEVVSELRDHGLLGPGPAYDDDDLRVARLAGQLLEQGLEVRHLRMYRQFADREAALVEQLVTPLLRQRNPESRRSALEQAEQLTSAGGALHQALLLKQLRASLRR